MALVVPFSQQQAYAAKFWYERLQYTAGPIALATGTAPVFAANGINRTTTPQWIARLSGLAATQNAGVALDFQFDRNRLQALADQGFTDALPAGVRALPHLDLPARDRLVLSTVNTTGAAVANFQLNYQVAMQRLTLAEKLLRGIDQLTADEQEALADKSLDVRGGLEKGIFPIPIEAQIERTYRNRVLYATERLLHVDAGTADSTFLTVRALEAGPDSFLVLRELAVEGSPSVTVSVDRDDDMNYMGVSGAAFVAADDRPWDVFVPALNFLTFHIQAAAPVSGVRVRIGIWHVRLSNLLRVRFGLARRGEVPDHTYLRAIAGVA